MNNQIQCTTHTLITAVHTNYTIFRCSVVSITNMYLNGFIVRAVWRALH